MNIDFWCLLAGHTDEISRAFRNRSLLQENWLLISASIVIGMVWLVLYLWENLQLQRRANSDTPQGLFYDLCKTHRLSRADINYLLKASEAHCHEQPAMVFIDPGILNSYISQAGSDARYYELLEERLFQ
ncbi:hypothetical protein [Gimesia maris]|jgi:hypothetical protein|uniref:Uncharacterized protein n=1 Tax=Gimesia maris TaxID=122 RepID=A0A3D3R0Y5_9PLAN|nr:hypothetical protein [Gimesia maris]MAC52265.1 hypothetical protein [Gimesia sp.]EDL61359.1 hypothetical protein PM8797T_12683 [Gimesia maris DSM 8797]QDU17574.1 hypothetical protein CA11_54170 [Gimesia maris]QEG19599.1 hypothetical protein GmarT_55000 [Gimesia maris]QGQ27564.1 hypothetical protein F1729_02250 [Gimesia maris]|tara:strand:- start:5930 stop:6319 length:390 start_codon:yes stop_codon:yes gene_type:complete